MKMGVKIQYVDKKTGKMKQFSYIEHTFKKLEMGKVIRKWYRNNPYAKRLNKEWICQDYRIDQQRPQRDVYSEAYIRIVEITEMEENYLTTLINALESEIDYPTVWDDGKNRYYEETIYCPKCGKRRKVLTSETHCEFCGFEFNKALKCPKCHTLNLKGSEKCKECGYEFRKESFVNNEDYTVKKDKDIKVTKCPKCGQVKSKYYNTCQECGFDYTGKKQCIVCKNLIDEKDKYCGYCGQKQIVLKKCNNCGEENNSRNKFCNYCGKKL